MAEGGPIGKTIGGVIGTILPSVVNAFTSGGPRRQFKWNKRAAQYANEQNRKNAEWLLEQERRIQEEQRRYDSPQSQMSRYLEAGLNPHMIYGSGASGGGVFPFHAPSLPGVQVQAPDASFPDIAGTYLAASQAQAAIGLQQAKTQESYTKQALTQVQTDIAKSNPMLNPHVYRATIFSLEALATQKAQESRYLSEFADGSTLSRAEQKIQADIDSMFQRLGLGQSQMELQRMDKQIKNKILESKEYENVLKEIQVKWMQDKELTPQHIFQGLMLILQKMM